MIVICSLGHACSFLYRPLSITPFLYSPPAIPNYRLAKTTYNLEWGGSRTVIISNYFFMISLLISFLCDKPKWLAYRRTIRAKISKV